MTVSKERRNLLIAGCAIGLASFLLVMLGNPANMGFCIACFIRDTMGALKFHSAPIVQYVRPEIIGLVLGSFIIALVKGDFRPTAGSQPVTRFVLGACVMIGALIFLGCPLRMIIRLAGGDLNALPALVGFVAGIFVATLFLNRGFSLGRSYPVKKGEGFAFPLIQVGLLALLLFFPSLLNFSESGPGSLRAPIAVALIVGIIVGAACQRTRFCTAGGIRDVILLKDPTLLLGLIAVFVSLLIANLIGGTFKLGFEGQAVAHTEWFWNFFGMFVVGIGSALLGGCPLRQLILAGEGNADSVSAVLGMAAGAAIAHNFGLASSGNGTTAAGRVAVVICLVIVVVIGFVNTKRSK